MLKQRLGGTRTPTSCGKMESQSLICCLLGKAIRRYTPCLRRIICRTRIQTLMLFVQTREETIYSGGECPESLHTTSVFFLPTSSHHPHVGRCGGCQRNAGADVLAFCQACIMHTYLRLLFLTFFSTPFFFHRLSKASYVRHLYDRRR